MGRARASVWGLVPSWAGLGLAYGTIMGRARARASVWGLVLGLTYSSGNISTRDRSFVPFKCCIPLFSGSAPGTRFYYAFALAWPPFT